MADSKTKTTPRPLSEDELNKVVGGVREFDAADDEVRGNGDRHLFGMDGNDYIVGGEGNDTLSGSSGNDDLDGSYGNDRLSGGDDNDTLYGGDGNDTLYGENGDDSIIVYPGEGADTAVGGNGADTLCLEARPDAYRIDFTSGGFDPNGDGRQLQPGSAGTVYFAAGGSVAFSEFERITHR